MEKQTELQLTETPLDPVLKDSGLALNEAEEIKQSFLPYFEQIAEIKELALKIDFKNPTELDEKIARDLRLKTVKIRTGSEQVKNERKRIHTLKGNLEQASWNLIKATCLLDEEKFEQVEKAKEIAEATRKAELKLERGKLLSVYTDPALYPLGEITEEAFNNLLNGFKLAKEAEEAAKIKAEEERVTKEKAEAEEKERMRVENEKLKKEAEEKEKALAIERDKVAKEKAAQEALRLAEQKKADDLLETQRKESAKKLAAEKEKQDAILKKEREEKAKIEKELGDKKEAERLAADKLKKEQEAKVLADKKAKSAPDKEKLTLAIRNLSIGDLELSNKDSWIIEKDIRAKFAAFKTWCETQINTL